MQPTAKNSVSENVMSEHGRSVTSTTSISSSQRLLPLDQQAGRRVEEPADFVSSHPRKEPGRYPMYVTYESFEKPSSVKFCYNTDRLVSAIAQTSSVAVDSRTVESLPC